MNYIFWDFNGTVLDDVKLCYDILCEMLEEEKRPLITFEAYLNIFTFPIKDYYEKLYDLKQTPYPVLADRFIKKYQPRSMQLSLHVGFIDTIKVLAEKGYQHVLLSASEYHNLMAQLKHYDIDHLFKDVLGTSDVFATSKIMIAKNYIEKNHIDPTSIVMIGDTLHDAEVAHELKCRIILYTKGHQHRLRFQNYETIDQIQDLLGKI